MALLLSCRDDAVNWKLCAVSGFPNHPACHSMATIKLPTFPNTIILVTVTGLHGSCFWMCIQGYYTNNVYTNVVFL